MPEAAWPDTHRGQRAVERMLEYAPSTGGLALWVRHEDLAADDPRAAGDAPPMATDGETLWYAPSFARLPLAEQTGWVARGVLHVAFGHARRLADLRARLGDVDARLFAACADAIVDASLAPHGWLSPPRGAVRLETLLKVSLGIETDVDRALREWDVERLYRAIDDRRPSPSGRGGRGGGRGSGKGDGDGTDRGDGRGAAGGAGQRPSGPALVAGRELGCGRGKPRESDREPRGRRRGSGGARRGPLGGRDA